MDELTAPVAPPDAPRRPLRIALFTDMYGPTHSGLLYAVHFLEGELLKAGHEVLVVAPACDGPNPHRGHPRRRELRLPSIKLPRVPAAVAGGRGFEDALARLEADPPDVIHVQGLGPVGLLGVWAADRIERPLMVTWHTDFEAYAEHYAALTPFLDAYYRLLRLNNRGMKRPQLQDMKRWIKVQWWRRGMSRRNLLNAARDMLEAAELVTTPSDKTAQRVHELAPAALVRVVPNGADALPPGPPRPHGSGPRILYVGRIAPEKNLELLLDAFRWVREDIPGAELVLVGEWRVGGALEHRLKRARSHEGVVLAGQVPRDELGPWYASADVFAFPSTSDTQALVLHEAAHAGLPIVTVDDELRLVVDPGVNGLVARPTPEALGRRLVEMLRLLEDPSFAERAHARSREMAGWWTVAHQSSTMIGLYEALRAREVVEASMRAVPPASGTLDG